MNSRWLQLAGVWLLYAAFGLITTALAPLAGVIETDLELSHVAMGSIMGAWQLVYIAAAIPGGMLLDRIGSRWALVIGGLILAASAFARSVAVDYWSLLAAVALFGLGGPIVSAGAPKVVAGLFAGADRGLAMGIYMTGPAVGGVISLMATQSVLMPWLGDSWRSVLALWSLVALAATIVWLLVARRTPASEVAVKPSGGLSGGITRRLLKDPAVIMVLVMGIGAFFINHGLANWLPELLQVGGMTAANAGFWAAVPVLVGIAGSLLIPRLATPARRHPILIGLCVMAAAASIALQVVGGPVMMIGLILQGIARSSLMTLMILTLMELPSVGDRHAGTASGLFFSAAEVGGVLGPLGLGFAYDLFGGFEEGLMILTGVSAAIALMAVRLRTLTRVEGRG